MRPQEDRHLAALENFLDEGSTPVYAGFGSMPKKDQNDNIPLIIEAARSAGRRVVITDFHGTETAPNFFQY